MIEAWQAGHEVEVIALVILGMVLVGAVVEIVMGAATALWMWLKRSN